MKKMPSTKLFLLLHHAKYKIAVALLFCISAFSPAIGQQWTILGNENQVSSVAASYATITVLDSIPYVFYREGTLGKVKRKNPASGTWEQVGDNIGTNITYTNIYSNRNDSLFVAYVDAANGNRLAVETYNSVTNTWEPLNSTGGNLYVSAGQVTNAVGQYASTPRCSMAFDSNNQPYIAFGDGASLSPYVKKFDGTSWVTIGGGAVNSADTAVALSLVLDETDEPWLVFCDLATPTTTTGKMTLYHYTGSVWVPIATPITAAVRHTSMARNNAGNLVIGYFNTANTNKATVITYNKTANTFGTATTLGNRDSPNISVISDAAYNVYCSFLDFYVSTNRSIARVFKQSVGSTSWPELKEPASTVGVDEPVVTVSIGIGGDTSKPYIVYTKNNTSSVVTPVVRRFSQGIAVVGVITGSASNITPTSVTIGGNVTADAGFPITERGIVYGTTTNPTIANNKVADINGGLGVFSVSISALNAGTNYYARAYATNTNGTTYGANSSFTTSNAPDPIVTAPKQMEKLNRGLVAVRTSANQVYIGWRLFGTDPAAISFNVYHNGTKVNSLPITNSTNYVENTVDDGTYTIAPILNGAEQAMSEQATVWAQNYLNIPLSKPSGGTTPSGEAYTYVANDASVGDLDGDGEYEIVLKWDPSNAKDNSQAGYTGNVYLDAYKMNGTRLWRIDLGRNIRAGAHYTQFMVYDLDGDGKAEVACKTADATVDGTNVVIGNPTADYRNTDGYVLSGPEFLTIFNGMTGAAMATSNYLPARGTVSSWGDSYGNRVDRFIAAVAYLDGTRPSLVMGRGYYTRLVRAAWDWRDGQLTSRWVFDSNSGAAGDLPYRGQGNHQMSIGDGDGDGKQEIYNGSSAINDNGNGLYATGLGHGDAMHMSDIDPDRPGLEVWQPYEDPASNGNIGAALVDAKTGERIFTVAEASADVGRAMAGDIDPRYKGYEVWAARGNLYTAKGVTISTTKPASMNFGIWWDGDLLREFLDGTTISKWNHLTNTPATLFSATGTASNNSTKSTPALSGDLLGDWREEVMYRTSDNNNLRIYTTTAVTDKRIYTLMHDPQYRVAIAWQNSAYNQPPHTGFYLGDSMQPPPVPNIFLAGNQPLPIKLLVFEARAQGEKVVLNWTTENEKNNGSFTIERSVRGEAYSPLYSTKGAGNSSNVNKYVAMDNSPVKGANYYRLKQTDFDGRIWYSPIRTVDFGGKENVNFTVFPNPVASTVQLQLFPSPASNSLHLSVNSIEGKRVFQTKGSLQQLNTALNAKIKLFAKGSYIIQIVNAGDTYTTRIVKN